MTTEQSSTKGEGESDRTEIVSAPSAQTDSSAASLPDIEPLSMPMLGKLFGVPLIIISIIVGGAIVVVMLFGAPTAPSQRSIDDLLTAIEGSVGGRQMGMLLPRTKEHWQAGLELSLRLEAGEVAEEKLAEVASRLGKALDEVFPHVTHFPQNEQELDASQRAEQRQVEYLIRALGKTGKAQAIGSLMKVMDSGREPYVTLAIQQFGDLRDVPESARAVQKITAILRSGSRPETAISACTVLSLLADPGDKAVLNALSRAYNISGGEIAWSAALALARLGSDVGRTSLADLLDRAFWEADDRLVIKDAGGSVHRYPMPPERIDRYLTASMDAASNLDDPDLWEMIEKLKSDPSPEVSRHAVAVLASRKEAR